jgi:hypothetical protein
MKGDFVIKQTFGCKQYGRRIEDQNERWKCVAKLQHRTGQAM